MGYDFRLFAVESISEDGYAPLVADIHMRGIGSGPLWELHNRNTPEKPHAYIYGLDGNKRYKKDRYGAAMSVSTVDAVIDALKKEIVLESPPYRRFEIALAFLKSFKKKFGKNARVLGYGE